ncbi:LacI family transcriptional regulator [Termitidicoccus mucosus]|uniref:HTH lacI-type domain-containing protein n=1 Tax=Termitidicoccus mucosus TaxID=1184151 RepID=A0A178IEE0_9BACT|nr:hypothetical protein AW736_23330 [Opitutaceae bacterium TSB47]
MKPKEISSATSVRDLARVLGLSHTTVAQGLRNKPSVKAETRKRIHAAAKAAGYQHNPLTGAVMAGMRRKRGTAFQGVVALVDLDGSKNRPFGPACYISEIVKGASERAAQLGFKIKTFDTTRRHSGAATQEQLVSMFHEGGISGVFLLPVKNHNTINNFDWSRYAGVYADYSIGENAFHSICPNHYNAMNMVLHRLHALGYRRPGLVLNQYGEERLLHRWGDAYWMFKNGYDYNNPEVPTLIAPVIDRAAFSTWFTEHNPDVVLCIDAKVMDWMRECGAKIATTHGYFCLNTTQNPGIACAGLDQQPRLLGARGIEQVTGQIYRNEYGISEHPSTTLIPAQWIDGPTVRASELLSRRWHGPASQAKPRHSSNIGPGQAK